MGKKIYDGVQEDNAKKKAAEKERALRDEDRMQGRESFRPRTEMGGACFREDSPLGWGGPMRSAHVFGSPTYDELGMYM